MSDANRSVSKGPFIPAKLRPPVGSDLNSQPPLHLGTSREELLQQVQAVLDQEDQQRLGLTERTLPEATLQTHYSKSENAHGTTLDGEAVLLNLDDGVYYSLNRVGTLMWELLTSDHSPARVAAAICKRFTVNEEKVRADLLTLVTRLCQEGLLIEQS